MARTYLIGDNFTPTLLLVVDIEHPSHSMRRMVPCSALSQKFPASDPSFGSMLLYRTGGRTCPFP